MMSRPDWLVSLVKSSEICEDVLFVIISSLTLPFRYSATILGILQDCGATYTTVEGFFVA